MNVLDIMTDKPVTVHQDSALHDALKKMDEVGCHHLPVTDSYGHLVGILSDRDCRKALNKPAILREYWEDEKVTTRMPVRVLMTPAPIVIEPSASIDEAARLMLMNHISCLPVMRSETLIGIVTTSDILMAVIKMNKRAAALPEDN